jgi:hypothetical protein
MGFEVSWRIDGRILQVTFSGNLRDNDFLLFDQEVTQLLSECETQTHLLIDGRGLQSMPHLSLIQRLRFPRHSRLGWVISVGMSQKPGIWTSVLMLAQVFKLRHHDAKTLDDALIYLQRIDSTLPCAKTGVPKPQGD